MTRALFFLMSTGLCGTLAAQNPASPPSLVRRYGGTYETDQLLAEPRVQRELALLLGSEEQHLRRNLFVTGSIDVLGGMLVISGNAAHQGGEEEAVLCIAEPLAIHGAILTAGRVKVYSRVPDYEALPLCIKDWITQANSGHRDRWQRPTNVELVAPRKPGS